MVCHGTLAAERPPPACLTEFYLIMSVSGVFNAVVAPSLFSFVAEYPLILAAACLLGVLCYGLISWTDRLSDLDKVARILLSVGVPAVLC